MEAKINASASKRKMENLTFAFDFLYIGRVFETTRTDKCLWSFCYKFSESLGSLRIVLIVGWFV